MKAVHGIDLVRTLHDTADQDALSKGRSEFTERYRPVLFAFARRVGLEASEAEATVDSVLREIFALAAATPLAGAEESSRDWVFSAAGPRIARASLAALPALESESQLRKTWDTEWRRAVIRRGLDELYEAHVDDSMVLKAFELHTLEHKNVNHVAGDLGMSRSAVFGAKNRLMEQLREIVARLEEEF